MHSFRKPGKRTRIIQAKPAIKLNAKIVFKKPIRASLISSMLDDQIFKRMMKIDDVVGTQANGMYAIHATNNEPNYKTKQLFEYARKKGKKTSELNDQELARFLIR